MEGWNPFINQRGFWTPSRVVFPVTWLSKYWLEPSLTLWKEFKSYKGNSFPEITRKNYGTKKNDGALQVQGDERKYNPDGWRFSWGRHWPEGKAGTCACDEKSNIGCGNIHLENICNVNLSFLLLYSRKRELFPFYIRKMRISGCIFKARATATCRVGHLSGRWKSSRNLQRWWFRFWCFHLPLLWLVADRPHEQWARRKQTLFADYM